MNAKAKEIRLGIGADILKEMERKNDLPLPNAHRLAKVMMECFVKDGHEEILRDLRSRWHPTEEYWRKHLYGVRRVLRNEERFFEYVHTEKDFRGQWKFVSKQEYESSLHGDHNNIATRIDHHNERLEDGRKRWKLDIPVLPDVALLN